MSNNLHLVALSCKISWLQTKDSVTEKQSEGALHCWLAAAMRKKWPCLWIHLCLISRQQDFIMQDKIFTYLVCTWFELSIKTHSPNSLLLLTTACVNMWTCQSSSSVCSTPANASQVPSRSSHTSSWSNVAHLTLSVCEGEVSSTTSTLSPTSSPTTKLRLMQVHFWSICNCARSSLRFLVVASKTNWRFIESAMRGDWVLASCYVIYVMSSHESSLCIDKEISIQRRSRFSVDSLYCKAGNYPAIFFHFVLSALDLKRSKVSTLNLVTGPWTGPVNGKICHQVEPCSPVWGV